jgi:hypothetical protein
MQTIFNQASHREVDFGATVKSSVAFLTLYPAKSTRIYKESCMAEHGEHIDFWKGLVVGTLAGMAAAAYARGDFKRLFTVAPCTEAPDSEPLAFEPDQAFRQLREGLILRREAAESAGDPTRLSPSVSTTRSGLEAVSIERPGGAPGGATAPEILEVPGHPGQLLDHSNVAQPVKPAPRTLDLSASGN